ncbi:MAG TPA: hypothetical protein VFS43_17465 [Polyangiaceae bacterium]|nr:hypothetical protein [Polyangiaceae bacterium]
MSRKLPHAVIRRGVPARRLDGVPLHRTSEAIFEALGDALERLRASMAGASLSGGNASGP